jgi:hypothetical protein
MLHVPIGVLLASPAGIDLHILSEPVIGAGNGFTDIAFTAKQPAPNV